MFFQRRSCSKDISYLAIIIPSRFQTCTYSKIIRYLNTSVATIVCYLTTPIAAIYFVFFFTAAREAIHFVESGVYLSSYSKCIVFLSNTWNFLFFPVVAIHLMSNPFSIIKGQLHLYILSNLLCFSEKELQQGDILITNCDTFLVSDMYILKDNLLFDDTNYSNSLLFDNTYYQLQPSIFFYFTEAREAIHYVESGVYFTILSRAIHYNKWSLIDSSKFERCCVYMKKEIAALFF